MKAETNGYTQLCDKCHRRTSGDDLHRITVPPMDSIENLTFAWHSQDGRWINQLCTKCHLMLTLEGHL